MGEQQVRGTASDCGNRETRHCMMRSSCGVILKSYMVDTSHRVVKGEYSVLNSIKHLKIPRTLHDDDTNPDFHLRKYSEDHHYKKSVPGEPGSTVMAANQNAGKCSVAPINRHPLERIGRWTRRGPFASFPGRTPAGLSRAGAPARASYEILPYATGTERGKNREASPSPPPRTPPRRSPP